MNSLTDPGFQPQVWLGFLKDLRVGVDTVLVGHSSGAQAAMRLAEEQTPSPRLRPTLFFGSPFGASGVCLCVCVFCLVPLLGTPSLQFGKPRGQQHSFLGGGVGVSGVSLCVCFCWYPRSLLFSKGNQEDQKALFFSWGVRYKRHDLFA